MMNSRMIEDGIGVRAARAAKRRFWWTAGLSLFGAVGVGIILTMGKVAPGHFAPGWAIAAVIAFAVVLIAAIHFNNRMTDELNRMNALKAHSFGLHAYFFLQWAWLVLAGGGLVPPTDPLLLFIAVAIVTMGRYSLLKFAR